MPKKCSIGDLFWKIRGVLTQDFFEKLNTKRSIKYFITLDSRRQKEVVIVIKDWMVGKKTHTSSTYFHVKENWSIPGIKLQINLMAGPGGIL